MEYFEKFSGFESMLVDGTLCIAKVQGTELERFSGKSSRFVALIFHDDVHAYVYPISSRPPKSKPRFEAGSGFLITQHGLFRLNTQDLSPTGERIHNLEQLLPMVRRHFKERELQFHNTEPSSLHHTPFKTLSYLKQEEKPKEKPKKIEPVKPKTDEEVWQDYLAFELENDLKRNPKD